MPRRQGVRVNLTFDLIRPLSRLGFEIRFGPSFSLGSGWGLTCTDHCLPRSRAVPRARVHAALRTSTANNPTIHSHQPSGSHQPRLRPPPQSTTTIPSPYLESNRTSTGHTMRLIAGITTAALSGLAAAATQPSADVFVFQSSSWQSSPETPSIPKEVARHILLQRASTPRSLHCLIALADANSPVQISRQRYGSDLRDIPSSINTDAAVAHIARFGKSPAPLFSQPERSDASQLVILVEGIGADDTSRLRKQLGQQIAFTVADPPSATANNNLMSLFRGMGVASSQQCDLSAVLNPFEADCWTGPSSVVKYDLRTVREPRPQVQPDNHADTSPHTGPQDGRRPV